jgi:membrane associated rhomboid family serine protease
MIPLSDHNSTRHFPVVSVALIVLNVVVFLIDLLTPVAYEIIARNRYGQIVSIPQEMGSLSYHFAMIPAYVTGQAGMGGARPFLPLSLTPAWLTIFTSMFLHANWLHVGGNMLYLWIFGNNIEDVLGKARFLLFYLLCGILAAVVHVVSDPASTIPTVGASGAAAGLMGAYILLYPQAKILSLVPICGIIGTLIEIPAILVIGYWIVLQVLNAQWLQGGGMLTQGGGVAYLAHIGGFVSGMLLLVLMGGRRLLPPSAPLDLNEGNTPRHGSADE